MTDSLDILGTVEKTVRDNFEGRPDLKKAGDGAAIRYAQGYDRADDDDDPLFPRSYQPPVFRKDPEKADQEAPLADSVNGAIRIANDAVVAAMIERSKRAYDAGLAKTREEAKGMEGNLPLTTAGLVMPIIANPKLAHDIGETFRSIFHGVARVQHNLNDLLQTDLLGLSQEEQRALSLAGLSPRDEVRIARARAEGGGWALSMLYEASPYMLTALLTGPVAGAAVGAAGLTGIPAWLAGGSIFLLSDMAVDAGIGFTEIPMDISEDASPITYLQMIHKLAQDPRAAEWMQWLGTGAEILGLDADGLLGGLAESDDDDRWTRRWKRAAGEAYAGLVFNLGLAGIGAGAKGAKQLHGLIQQLKSLGGIGGPDDVRFAIKYHNGLAESMLDDGTAIFGSDFRRAVYGEDVDLPEEALPFVIATRAQMSGVKGLNIAMDVRDAIDLARNAIETHTRASISLEWLKQPLDVSDFGTGAKSQVQKVAATFDQKYPKLDPINSPADRQTIMDHMRAEVGDQLDQVESGADWYTENMKAAMRDTARLIDLKRAQKRHRFMVLAAINSQQKDPYPNWKDAISAFEMFERDGVVPLLRPNGKKWGVEAVESSMQLYQKIMDYFGDERAALRWLMKPHTGTELAEMRRASGLYKEKPRLAQYLPSETSSEDIKLGVYVFGPKIGNFFLNNTGINPDVATVDRWLTRSYRRLTGSLTDDVSPRDWAQGKLRDQPRGIEERAVIEGLVREVSQEYDLTTSQGQAVYWFFEKRLWGAHGHETGLGNFKDAAARILRERGVEEKIARSVDIGRGGDAGRGSGAAVPGDDVGGRGAGVASPGEAPLRSVDADEGPPPGVTDPFGNTEEVDFRGQLELLGDDPDLQQIFRDPEGRELVAEVIAGLDAGTGLKGLTVDEQARVALMVNEYVAVTKKIAPDVGQHYAGNLSGEYHGGPKTAIGKLLAGEDPDRPQFIGTAPGRKGYFSSIYLRDDELKRAKIFRDPSQAAAFTKYLEMRAKRGDAEDLRPIIETLAHETGHSIDIAHVGFTEVAMENLRSISPEKHAEVMVELIDASKLARPNLWDDAGREARLRKQYGYDQLDDQGRDRLDKIITANTNRIQAYREDVYELLADALGMYMLAPDTFKSVAPQVAQMIRRGVNEHSFLKKIIQFASWAALGIPIAGAVAGGEEGDDGAL